MKIFFIGRGVPTPLEPQWGSFEYDQALALKQLGHDVVIMSVDARYRKYHRKYGISKEIHEGIPHYNIFAGFIWGKPLRKVSMRLHTKVKQTLILRLFKHAIITEGMPNMIYGHYLGGCSMALAIKQKYGIPAVGIEHWSELGYQDIKKPILEEAARTYPSMDCQLVVSSALRDNIKQHIGINTIVVNNMVGREFCYVQTERKERMVRYVTTGNLLPVKGFDNLINAFSLLHLQPDTWSLNIVGGGKERDNIQKQINELCLSENIRLCGRKSREEVVDLLQNSDVYVMSSRSETFGVAAIEALACGLPVIATDCGGARDFLTKENGIICPVNDVYGLSDAIFTMYKYHKGYNRAIIAEDCQKRFSSEAIGKQLEGIFEEVISKSQKK